MNNHDYTVSGPGGRVGESHYDSQILSGACWDIRTAVGQGTTDHIIFEALRNVPHPDTFEEFYNYLLTENDDNNNLNDGTPHGSDICAA